MFKSYEALYENGQVKWLESPPPIQSARIIITILEEKASPPRRTPPATLAGKAQILGDIISPIVSATEWECLK